MRLCRNTALSTRLTSSGACLMNGPVRGVRYSGRRNWHPTLMRWTRRSIPQSTMASIAQASPRRGPLYEEAYRDLFAMLDRLESRVGERSFLLGEQITEADWA